MTRVTTIIPAYNAEAFIREAVDSALAQTHREQEIIVVDDGSTDGTLAVLREYGRRIRVIEQKNSGHVAARNNAARVARGDCFAFLDADDLWEPTKLERQIESAQGDVGMVYTDRLNFGDTSRVSARASECGELLEGDLFERLLLGNPITVSSVIMRKDWFDRLGGFDPELLVCEDWDLWLRFAGAGGITRAVNEPLTHYRLHANSMSNNQSRMCQGRLKVVQRALESPRGLQAPRQIRRRALAATWKCSAWYAMPWKRSAAFRWYARSAFCWPWDRDVYKGMIKCCLGRI